MTAYNLTRMRTLGKSVCRRHVERETWEDESQNAENGSKATKNFITQVN